MNICFVLFSFSNGGIGRVTSIIAKELNKIKDINCYAVGFTNYGETSPCIDTFQVQYIYHSNLSMKDAILKQHYIKKVKKFVEKNKIDVIIGCGAMFYPVSILIAKICHIKVISWEHTAPNVVWDYKFEKEAREFGARFSDCNLLLTKQAQEIFNQRYPKKNNLQIYNPIDPELYNKKITYNTSSKKIISIGRFCYPKNFERLVQIAAKILSKHKDWIWDIYGKGIDEEKIKCLIQKQKMGNQINLCGQVNDLYERYSQYAFIVMTSRYEGFPMTLLEAAANGLPMVAFDVLTGPREIIEDGINGYLCNHESDEEMIKKLEVIMDDENLRQKMSSESKKTTEKFQLDMICKQWVELLQGMEL